MYKRTHFSDRNVLNKFDKDRHHPRQEGTHQHELENFGTGADRCVSPAVTGHSLLRLQPLHQKGRNQGAFGTEKRQLPNTRSLGAVKADVVHQLLFIASLSQDVALVYWSSTRRSGH
eukprot:1874218-Rhodomonas_salina.1